MTVWPGFEVVLHSPVTRGKGSALCLPLGYKEERGEKLAPVKY